MVGASFAHLRHRGHVQCTIRVLPKEHTPFHPVAILADRGGCTLTVACAYVHAWSALLVRVGIADDLVDLWVLGEGAR